MPCTLVVSLSREEQRLAGGMVAAAAAAAAAAPTPDANVAEKSGEPWTTLEDLLLVEAIRKHGRTFLHDDFEYFA